MSRSMLNQAVERWLSDHLGEAVWHDSGRCFVSFKRADGTRIYQSGDSFTDAVERILTKIGEEICNVE